MSGLQNDWYVAGPDGEAIGPLSRVELAQAQARGAFARDALAWHVDHSEWQPVMRVVATMTAVQAGMPASRAKKPATKAAPPAAAKAQTPKRPPMPAPPRDAAAPARKPTPAARADSNEEREARQMRETLAARAAPTGRVVQGAPARAPATAEQAAFTGQFGVAVQRLLARSIDMLSIGLLGAAIAWGLVLHGSAEAQAGVLGTPNPAWLLFLAVFVMIPLDTVLLGLTGTTPGKYLLGVQVTDARGERIGIGRAWQRAITVAWRGVGLGLPPLALLATIIAGVQYAQQGSTAWDRDLAIETRAAPMDNRRWQIAIAALIAGLIILSTEVWSRLALQIAQGTQGAQVPV